MRYFYNPRKKATAHIWMGTDTACRMWSTGGIKNKQMKVLDDRDGRRICQNCESRIDAKMHSISVKSNAQIAKEILEYQISKEIIKENGIIYLTAKYEDKDIVKLLGAKYNPTLKKWYISKDMDALPFKKWIPSYEENIIQRPDGSVHHFASH